MKKTYLASLMSLGLIALTGCDDYLDINTDPNAPAGENISASMLMPAAEMDLANAYGNYLRIVGGYHAQHYAQQFGTTNYLDYSQFNQSATRTSSTYTDLMQGSLMTLETIREKSRDAEPGTYLAATVLRAFCYQTLVDMYGDIPYTEALQGNPTPAYDEGSVVYAGILAELDEALEGASASDLVCTNFLLPGETAGAWIQFANALKLRILSRESGVVDVQAALDALVAEGNFPAGDIAFAGCWSNASGQMNPFYSEECTSAWGSNQQNVVGNIAIINTLRDWEDPRLEAFWMPADADAARQNTVYHGAISGSNFGSTNTYQAAYWNRPVASYDMPVYLLCRFETDFFLAEYYAKKGQTAQAEAAYAAGIEASFEQAGVAGAADYTAAHPLGSDYRQSIGVQKWIALSGTNNWEAYCEVRRMDYPAFGTLTGTDLYNELTDDSYHPELYVPGTLYTPTKSVLPAGKLLERYPYASASSSRNSKTPAAKDPTEPIFWGK